MLGPGPLGGAWGFIGADHTGARPEPTEVLFGLRIQRDWRNACGRGAALLDQRLARRLPNYRPGCRWPSAPIGGPLVSDSGGAGLWSFSRAFQWTVSQRLRPHLAEQLAGGCSGRPPRSVPLTQQGKR